MGFISSSKKSVFGDLRLLSPSSLLRTGIQAPGRWAGGGGGEDIRHQNHRNESQGISQTQVVAGETSRKYPSFNDMGTQWSVLQYQGLGERSELSFGGVLMEMAVSVQLSAAQPTSEYVHSASSATPP